MKKILVAGDARRRRGKKGDLRGVRFTWDKKGGSARGAKRKEVSTALYKGHASKTCQRIS